MCTVKIYFDFLFFLNEISIRRYQLSCVANWFLIVKLQFITKIRFSKLFQRIKFLIYLNYVLIKELSPIAQIWFIKLP